MFKFDIKAFLITNASMFSLLFITIVIKLTLPAPLFYISVFVWALLTVYANYNLFVKSSELKHVLNQVDKKGLFASERDNIVKTYESINDKAEFFKNVEQESVRYAYEQVKKQAENNIATAIKYMENYDYHNRPFPFILMNIKKNNTELTLYLNRLFDSVIKIDSSVQDVDTEELMDLLQSLNEIAGDDANTDSK